MNVFTLFLAAFGVGAGLVTLYYRASTPAFVMGNGVWGVVMQNGRVDLSSEHFQSIGRYSVDESEVQSMVIRSRTPFG